MMPDATPRPSRAVSAASSGVLVLVSLAIGAAVAELALRLKNRSMNTYDIEMWRYAKELKVKSDDPQLDFDHVKSKSAVLQKVTIRLNEWGLRGAAVEPLPAHGRRILVLGGSIALGWGVPEEKTMEARLEEGLRTDRKSTRLNSSH